MKVQVNIINAFVDGDTGGNPAGVVLEAGELSQGEKMAIASKVGLSETAFVSPSLSADFKLEFFTPTRQIAHCGHATIATFVYLQKLNLIGKTRTSKETIDGKRDIYIDNDMAFMEQVAPKYIHINDHIENILSSLNLRESDLLEGSTPVVVNTGNSFLIVPLKNMDAVKNVRPRMSSITSISEDLNLVGYYLFSPDTKIPGRDAGTRMFAPRFGINEESATGMAAGPLACFCHDRLKIEKNQFLIEQGQLMTPASPSVLTVRLTIDDGRIANLMAGGKAKVVRTMSITL